MGHNLATWKTLEDMMIELKKKGIVIPVNVLEDLRAAKSMIKLSCGTQGSGDAIMKVEEYMAGVEAFLVTEGQKVFGSQHVDRWLERLEEAGAHGEVCDETLEEEKFVTGVPRDQKWVRIEPIGNLSVAEVEENAKSFNLQIKPQKDGKLVVYGQPENLKVFLKKITAEQQLAKK
jgi:hypothetical protein